MTSLEKDNFIQVAFRPEAGKGQNISSLIPVGKGRASKEKS